MKTLVRVLAIATCAITLAGSVYGLWHVCTSEDLAKMPWLIAVAVIAGFDGSALVFGLKVAANPKAVAAWAGVILCAVLSAAAQVLAAPTEAHWWRLLHGAPAITAIWTLHNAVKEDKPPKRQRKVKVKGAGTEAVGAGPGTTAFTGPLASEPEHEASVLQLVDARREGERRAPGRDAAPPMYSLEDMAGLVSERLGDAEPSQRKVTDLCKAIDATWTQANARAVSSILKARRQETGT